MEIRGEFFYFNGEIFPVSRNKDFLSEYDNSIYEVLRVSNSTPLFLEDHFNRFENSFHKIGRGFFPDFKELKEILERLIAKNKLQIGNLRIELFLHKNILAAFFIPHHYPDEIMYQTGVKLVTFQIERPNPEVKQSVVNNLIRKEIAEHQKASNAYEILLVNREGLITEGSKSNILMIKDTIIYTPLSEQILNGITRQKVLMLARKLNIEVHEESIELSKLNNFDACFITGTSPKVLPVNSIGAHSFNPQNEIVSLLTKSYNQLIKDYCSGSRNLS